MSIVGPRPHALGSTAEDDAFWSIEERYWDRHAIKPGLTGLAQVRGFRGATVRRADLSDRLKADLEYLDGWTLGRDLAIVFRTLGVMVHRNAY
jgi:polysaccharide biosynthesis protein PslA